MQLDCIANILQLPDVLVQDVHVESPRAILVVLEPTPYVQACPQCHSSHHVIRKGRNANRRVRHTSLMDMVFFLCLPAIRMYCQACCAGFVWQYAFVEPKKRYSSYLCRLVSEGALGSTCLHLARMNDIPHSTLHHFYCLWILEESRQLQEAAWKQAMYKDGLILGIDDFATRKGHTYNTGIHDIRGERLLDVVQGRTLDDLRTYAQKHPHFSRLQVKAVVLDLA